MTSAAAPLNFSTYALAAATTPYVSALAARGVDRALADDTGFGEGLNIMAGKVMHPAVAGALGL